MAVYPCLYGLIRTDIDSMNPGKAIAQGMHAANAFDHAIEDLRAENPAMEWTPAQQARKAAILDDVEAWRKYTRQGFGTTITLGSIREGADSKRLDIETIRAAVEFVRAAGFPAEVVHDDTYPLVDGSVVHLIPLDTTAYVFGTNEELRPLLARFNLHA